MLKSFTIKKLCLSSFCLLVIFILYLFPKLNKNDAISMNTTYKKVNVEDVIFLEDKNGYISRVNTIIEGKTLENKIKCIIENLTIGNTNKSSFTGLIPKDTKLKNITISDDIAILNFSSEFLNVSKDKSEKMLEAIIFSITNLKNINKVKIYVENNPLSTIPNTSIKLSEILDRSFGINKFYDLSKLRDSVKTTVYYLSKNEEGFYYVPVTKVTNSKQDKIEIIIKELTSSPSYNTSLMSYLNAETVLLNYEVLDKKMTLDFNNAIFINNLTKDIEEEVTYSINLSIKENYDVDEVFYNVNNEKIASFNLKSLD